MSRRDAENQVVTSLIEERDRLRSELEQVKRERDELLTAMKSVSVENLMDALAQAERERDEWRERAGWSPADDLG